MKTELDDLIEKWAVFLEDYRKDADWIATYSIRDSNREKARREMNTTLEEYLSGKITIEEFRDMFHRKTFHDWAYFGLKGLSGAMFFNTLVKYIPDKKSLDSIFKTTIVLPINDTDAKLKMKQFFTYLNTLIQTNQISKRHIQPARTPFFFSAWWHLQNPELWPIFYPEVRTFFENEGIFTLTDDVVEDYFTFKETVKALRSGLNLSPWELLNFLTWLEERKQLPVVDIPPKEVPPKKEEDTPVESITHTQVQWMLAQIGKKLGCNVWIAKNDWNNEYQGEKLGNFSIKKFPEVGLDSSIQNKIEYIDVVWIRGSKHIVAAFEVEHSTSIHSGILRLSDLTLMAPNLNFRFYIVVPEERMKDVRNELSRPTFQSAGLNEMCGFFSEELLNEKFRGIMEFADNYTVIERTLAERVESVDW